MKRYIRKIDEFELRVLLDKLKFVYPSIAIRVIDEQLIFINSGTRCRNAVDIDYILDMTLDQARRYIDKCIRDIM